MEDQGFKINPEFRKKSKIGNPIELLNQTNEYII